MNFDRLRDLFADASTALRPDVVRTAVRNPAQIPMYVAGVLFPSSKWGPNWREADGFITFESGGFAGGSPTRPELSARIYREARQLEEFLGDRTYDRALEVGCGYGRLSGWISEYADETVGVDPNAGALAQARTLYPHVEYVETLGQDLPFADDAFDLAISWGVLQHVPPDAIDDVAAEVRRVLAGDGTFVCCELTSGESGRASWVRDRSRYESLFEPFSLVEAEGRPAERTFDYAEYADTMVFRREHPDAEVTTGERPTRTGGEVRGVHGVPEAE